MIKELLKLNGKELDIKYPIEFFDKDGNETYSEFSDGYWIKREFDKNGNETYYENSDDFWSKIEFNDNGNQTYYENSKGLWWKKEFDNNGNKTYYEDSEGLIEGNRPIKEMSIEQIQKLVGFKVKIIE